jgi:hypothetical protein
MKESSVKAGMQLERLVFTNAGVLCGYLEMRVFGTDV